MVLSLSAMGLAGCGECEHTYGDWIVVKEASYTAAGSQERTCTKCGEKETGSIEKLVCTEHTFGEWATTTEPGRITKGEKERACTKCNKKEKEDIPELGVSFKVVVKDASGTKIVDETVTELGKTITKPADPTAPEGKVFYGWKNVKNGGQIWNFENDALNKIYEDVELEPLFIDAGVEAKYLEAEFCPDITNFNGKNMPGATYSGGQEGKGLVREDAHYEYGSHCEQGEIKYYEDQDSLMYVEGTAPAGATQYTGNPKEEESGYFIHFMYVKGDTLTWKINVSEQVNDATIFGIFSGEYGIVNDINNRISSFSQTSFPITVNGTPLEYGNITLNAIPEIGKFLPFQEYILGMNVSLKAGENIIQMKVDNTDSLNGTIASTSPCVDAIKVYTKATITWDNASLTNIYKE